ncbi:hypothetical protein ACSTKU_00025, partial [Vibrio parahaemolyticus]
YAVRVTGFVLVPPPEIVADPVKVSPRSNATTSPGPKTWEVTFANVFHAEAGEVPALASLPAVAST